MEVVERIAAHLLKGHFSYATDKTYLCAYLWESALYCGRKRGALSRFDRWSKRGFDPVIGDLESHFPLVAPSCCGQSET